MQLDPETAELLDKRVEEEQQNAHKKAQALRQQLDDAVNQINRQQTDMDDMRKKNQRVYKKIKDMDADFEEEDVYDRGKHQKRYPSIKSKSQLKIVNLPLDKILKLANDRDITIDEPVLNAIQEICEPQDLKEMFDINNSPICTFYPNILMDD